MKLNKFEKKKIVKILMAKKILINANILDELAKDTTKQRLLGAVHNSIFPRLSKEFDAVFLR